MSEQSIIVHNRVGLHSRPAALFVQTAKRFPKTRIEVAKADQVRDAKSILGVLTLAVTQGTEITIRTEGDDADAALAALVEIVEAGLGE